MVLLRALGAILVATILGIFLDFSGGPTKRKIDWLVISMIFPHLTKVKTASGLYQSYWWILLIWGAAWSLAVFASIVQVYVPTRILDIHQRNTTNCDCSLMVLSFLLSLCSEVDAFIGSSLLSSFGFAPVLAFLGYRPYAWCQELLMMKNYLKRDLFGNSWQL